MRLQRPSSCAAFTAAGLALATYWVALVVGVDGLALRGVYLAMLTAPTVVLIVRVVKRSDDRLAWGTLAAGVTLWNFGTYYLAFAELTALTASFPSVADLLWMSAYPLMFASFGIFAWPWLRRAPKTLALEMLAVGFGLTALVTSIVVPLMTGNVGGLSFAEQALNLIYPIADCALLSVALIGAMVVGRRGGRTWILLGAGALALVGADALWALSASAGTLASAMTSSALYPLWPGFAAVAAWLPAKPRKRGGTGGVGTNAAAVMAAIASIVLLVVNEWLPIPAASVVLAASCLLVAVHGTGRAMIIGLRAACKEASDRDLVDDVRDAMDSGELDVYFQPLVDVATGAVHGAEALLRWRRADGVFIPPDRFLPAVERSELIGPLTDWVLDRALAAAAGWHRSGHSLGVSVNLATRNLTEADLPGRVLTALRRNEFPAHKLTLEITETAAIEDNTMTGHVLRALRGLGVELSVDDFGTGHSSLIRLAEFPISEIKVDRSFVLGMHSSERPIVATAVQLARSLGLRVVAEGVEDQLTLDALAELRCDIAQGYHISRPLPAAEFAGWLNHPALV